MGVALIICKISFLLVILLLSQHYANGQSSLSVSKLNKIITNDNLKKNQRHSVQSSNSSYQICKGETLILNKINPNPINSIDSCSPANNVTGLNTNQLLFSPSSSTQYFLYVKDTSLNTILSIDTINITINPIPSLLADATVICFGQPDTFRIQGALPDSIFWPTTAGLQTVSSDPTKATIIRSDTFRIIAKNISNCKLDTTIIVQVNSIPIIDFFPPAPKCFNDNEFTFTSASFLDTSDPSHIAQNIWIIDDSIRVIGAEIFYHFNTIGDHTVRLKSITDRGCSDSSLISQIITVNPHPKARFDIQPNRQCFKDNIFQFNSTSTTPRGVINSWLWDFGDTRTDTISSVSHHYNNPGKYSIRLIVKNEYGCLDTLFKKDSIIIYKMPTAFFDQPDPHCFRNNQYTFTSSSTIDTPSVINLNEWTFQDPVNNFATGNSVTHHFSAPGNYSIKLKSKSSDGCVDSVFQRLTIYPHPVSDFSLPPVLCFTNNNFLFSSSSTVSSGIIDSCFWNFGDGVTAIGNDIRHSFTDPNILSYQVRLVTQTDKKCTDTISKSVVFKASPIVSLDQVASLSICSGEYVTFHATANSPVGSITSYQWYVGGTPITGATTPSLIANTSGVYQVSVANSNNCFTNSTNDTLIVHPLPEGDVVMPNNDFICEGENKIISSVSNANSYQWYHDGNLISGANASAYTCTLPGIYSIQLISSFGCKNFATGSISLQLRKKPEALFSYNSHCIATPVVFLNQSHVSQSGQVNWSWDFGDHTSSQLANPSHLFSTSGQDTVLLKVSSVDCPLLTSINEQIISIDTPILGIRYPSVNALINNNTLLQSRNIGDEVIWLPSTGLNSSIVSNPIFNYDRNTEYLIRIKDAVGCYTYDTLLVRVQDNFDIKVPTAFSPNGDGHNDYLDIFLVGVQLEHFWIYNRWGQLLFETTDPTKKWDGYFKGIKQPLETYVWQAQGLSPIGEKIIRRGQTILLK